MDMFNYTSTESSQKAEFRYEKNAKTQVSALSKTVKDPQISAFLLLIVESIMVQQMDAIPTVPWLCSSRLWLAILVFMGYVFMYCQVVCMSVAIVCMVNQTDTLNSQGNVSLASYTNTSQLINIADNACRSEESEQVPGIYGTYNWPKTTQGHILGAFYYGYIVFQVPAGILAEKFGGKPVLIVFYGLATVGTLLTPIAAGTHWVFVFVIRIVVGLGMGGVIPSIHTMWGYWAPPAERSRLVGISLAGSMIGSCIGLIVSGFLCQYGFAGGWPSIFYIFGLVTVMWLILWVTLVSDTPTGCRTISAVEKDYIINELKDSSTQHRAKKKIPWKDIMTSRPVWALTIAHVAFDWGMFTYFTCIPSYLNDVFAIDIRMNGLYSALPFLGMWVCSFISPNIADKLISSGIRVVTVRKTINSVSFLGAAFTLVGLSFVTCKFPALAISLLVIGVSFTGFSFGAWIVNHVDIAPRYGGILIGIGNTLASLCGIVAPYVASVLTPSRSSSEWQIVFFITAAAYVAGAILYNLLAAGTIESWAKVNHCQNDQKSQTASEVDVDKTDQIQSDNNKSL